MARRSQHIEQIMENQTHFDLNAAIENWRNELAAQANLSADDRRELETHLRDAISEFHQLGLNEEESFLLACHRVGQPQKLVEEFGKANPANVWRERLFWMWLAVFLSGTVGGLFRSLAFALEPLNFHNGSFVKGWLTLEIIVLMLSVLTPLVIAILLANGKLILQFSRLMALLENRRRLARTAFGFIALSFAFRAASVMIYNSTLPVHVELPAWNYLMPTIYSIVVSLLLIWLMPTQNRKPHQFLSR